MDDFIIELIIESFHCVLHLFIIFIKVHQTGFIGFNFRLTSVRGLVEQPFDIYLDICVFSLKWVKDVFSIS